MRVWTAPGVETQRCIAAGETDAEVSERWMREERPFIADPRPWERASVLVCGTPDLPHAWNTDVLVALPAPAAT